MMLAQARILRAWIAIAWIGIAGTQAFAQMANRDKEFRSNFENYYFGNTAPKNQRLADQYLSEAAQSGSEWAVLLLTQRQEKSAPGKALEAYLGLARNNNCVAQMRLADAYASGVLVKKNMTQAYFWLLLSKVNEWSRIADVDYGGGANMSYDRHGKVCGLAGLSVFQLLVKIEAKKALPAKLMQAAQDAATKWTVGEAEELLPAPTATARQPVQPDAKARPQPMVATAAPASVLAASPKLAETKTPSSLARVHLIKEGGTYVVPVEINGAIKLDFVIDSGASDVSVPGDVFSTLARTGTVKASDISGEQTYVLADGSKTQSITFTIRSLKVGDVVIENVRASVASSRGSLLLGQSFLERFKSWSFDNTKHELLLATQ